MGYLTIGWTVKETSQPIDAAGNRSFRCKLTKKSYTDENGVVHASFTVDEMELLKKIEALYPDWAKRLKEEGGRVYLDGVMTCTLYNGSVHQPLGSMDDAGNISGEIYLTYDGIANARGWGDKNVFLPYYNMEIKYEAINPPMPQVPDDIVTTAKYHTEYGLDNNFPYYSYSMDNQEFDIREAIPSGEKLDFKASFLSMAYSLDYCKTVVTKYYPVKVITSQLMRWTDSGGKSHEEELVIWYWYIVERTGTYYQMEKYDLYEFNDFRIKWDDDVIFDYTAGKRQEQYVIHGTGLNDCAIDNQVYIDLGVNVSRDNQRPEAIRGDYSEYAQKRVPRLNTSSDVIVADGVKILGSQGYTHMFSTDIFRAEEDLEIPTETLNGVYTPWVTCTYLKKSYMHTDVGQDISLQLVHEATNKKVSVWTPVVCMGHITDNRVENQMVEPDTDMVPLVLGCEFSMSADCTGPHINKKGYGNRDYSKYVKAMEVKFYFDVERDGQVIPANTWIDIGLNCEKGTFTIPAGVPEGEYQAVVRALAWNAPEVELLGGTNYNFRQEYHYASETFDVEISGKIVDFNVERVEPDLRERYQLPAYSSRLPVKNPLISRGERVFYNFKVYGKTENVQDILIKPSFYSLENGVRRRLCLYERQEKDGRVTYKSLNTMEDYGSLALVERQQGVSVFAGDFCLGKNTVALYQGQNPYENSHIRGRVLVNLEIYAVDNAPYLSYSNLENWPEGYCNRWHAEGMTLGLGNDWGDVFYCRSGGAYLKDFVVVGTH